MAKINVEELADSILPKLARQHSMLVRLASIGGSDIYQVSENWQVDVLKKDKSIIVADSVLTFEDAVQNPEAHTIFIPKNAAITQDLVKTILGRNTLTQIIFWEA